MENETKKKINKLIASGAKISDISQQLGLTADEVTSYIRKFFATHKTTKKDKAGVIINFPNYKTIQLKTR